MEKKERFAPTTIVIVIVFVIVIDFFDHDYDHDNDYELFYQTPLAKEFVA